MLIDCRLFTERVSFCVDAGHVYQNIGALSIQNNIIGILYV